MSFDNQVDYSVNRFWLPFLPTTHLIMHLQTLLKWVNPQDITVLGLDVAKAKIDICFLSSNQTLSYQIQNHSQAISQFSRELKQYWVNPNIPFVLESRGSYHLLLATTLKNDGWDVKEINPIITHQYIKHTVRGTKTDTTDAQLLAKIGIIEGKNLKSFDRDLNTIKLRMLISFLAHLETLIQQSKASLSSVEKWLASLGLQATQELKLMREAIMNLEKRARGLEKEIVAVPLNKEAEEKIICLDSITGISPLTAKVAYALFAHNTFNSKRAMLAYVGLDPKLKQSGTKHWALRISKRGNPYMRKRLFQASFCSLQHSPYFKSIYEKHIQKGKHHFITFWRFSSGVSRFFIQPTFRS